LIVELKEECNNIAPAILAPILIVLMATLFEATSPLPVTAGNKQQTKES